MTRLSATDIARNFSTVLNRIASGEEIEVTRNGATVAVMAPPKIRFLPPERFRELLASAPPVDEDFATDLRSLRAEAGPAETSWPS